MTHRCLCVGYSGTGKTSAAVRLAASLPESKVAVLSGDSDSLKLRLKGRTVTFELWSKNLLEFCNTTFVIDDMCITGKKEVEILWQLLNKVSRHNKCNVLVMSHDLKNNGVSKFLRFFNHYLLPAHRLHLPLLTQLTKLVGAGDREPGIKSLFERGCEKRFHYLRISYDAKGALCVDLLNSTLRKVDQLKEPGGKREVREEAGAAKHRDPHTRVKAYSQGCAKTESCLHYVLDLLLPRELLDETDLSTGWTGKHNP